MVHAKKKNYYAIKKGYKTGIFEKWDECKEFVLGYKGAIYKGFSTLSEAQNFMNMGKNNDDTNKTPPVSIKTNKKYYAVKVGREPRIYETWSECLKSVNGYEWAVFKSYPTREEAEAFIKGNEDSKKIENAIKISKKILNETGNTEYKKKSKSGKKFYAVKRGARTGIFNSWNDCKDLVLGYKGAVYKGFSTLEEAENYLNIKISNTNNNNDNDNDNNDTNTNNDISSNNDNNDNNINNDISSNNDNNDDNINNNISSNNDNNDDNSNDNNNNDNDDNNNNNSIKPNFYIDLESENNKIKNKKLDDNNNNNNSNNNNDDDDDTPVLIDETINKDNPNKAVAYVDGSYNSRTKEYSYGAIIFYQSQGHHFFKKFNDQEMRIMRNVAGEIKGAMKAMEFCVDNKIPEVDIYYDYMGIEQWAMGTWKRNKSGTIQYKEYYDSIKSTVKVNFIKVKAHSNNKYNDIADRLAKKALDIKDKSFFNPTAKRKKNYRFKKF